MVWRRGINDTAESEYSNFMIAHIRVIENTYVRNYSSLGIRRRDRDWSITKSELDTVDSDTVLSL